MRQPEMSCLCVICRHSKARFQYRVQLVEQVGVDADAGCHREVTRAAASVEVLIFDLADTNAAGSGSESGTRSTDRIQRQSDVMRQCVGGSHWNDAQRHIASHYALQSIVY